MTELCLASIPHTGTYFTIKLFRDRKLQEIGLHDTPRKERVLYHGHIVKEGQIAKALELGKRMPLICPLRHPYWVEESWKRRGRDISELVHCFHQMVERFTDAHIFVLDGDREAELEKLVGATGIQLATDWPVIHSKQHTHSLTRDELQPSDEIERLCENIKPFLDRYYG